MSLTVVFKCTIKLLMVFTVVAEATIRPGFGSDPGEFSIYFRAEWNLPGIDPIFVIGEFDITPFKFDFDITKMFSSRVYLGLMISPGGFNKIINTYAYALKLNIYTLIAPMVILVDLLCRAKLQPIVCSPRHPQG